MKKVYRNFDAKTFEEWENEENVNTLDSKFILNKNFEAFKKMHMNAIYGTFASSYNSKHWIWNEKL